MLWFYLHPLSQTNICIQCLAWLANCQSHLDQDTGVLSCAFHVCCCAVLNSSMFVFLTGEEKLLTLTVLCKRKSHQCNTINSIMQAGIGHHFWGSDFSEPYPGAETAVPRRWRCPGSVAVSPPAGVAVSPPGALRPSRPCLVPAAVPPPRGERGQPGGREGSPWSIFDRNRRSKIIAFYKSEAAETVCS